MYYISPKQAGYGCVHNDYMGGSDAVRDGYDDDASGNAVRVLFYIFLWIGIPAAQEEFVRISRVLTMGGKGYGIDKKKGS
ncbi:MAG TPA: hypothetical protein PLK99_00475 [Burkholderiales bacterium]|nr:hypothetical protein [Burkholderiales bacterium]